MTTPAGADAPPNEFDEVKVKVQDHRFIPGQPDMWAFVLFETLVFTSYFVVYLLFRAQHHELYLQAQANLDLRIGIFNTIALLLSSWAVARCVQASRDGAYRSALTNAFMTIFFGFVFFVSKVLEWAKEIRMGNGFTTNEFFQHYFFLTSIHFLHLLIGFIVMGVVIYQLWSPKRRSQELVETGATYWHTVDFLWVLIFALLYVVR
jgi:nitric oxide reductase NorE protein